MSLQARIPRRYRCDRNLPPRPRRECRSHKRTASSPPCSASRTRTFSMASENVADDDLEANAGTLVSIILHVVPLVEEIPNRKDSTLPAAQKEGLGVIACALVQEMFILTKRKTDRSFAALPPSPAPPRPSPVACKPRGQHGPLSATAPALSA